MSRDLRTPTASLQNGDRLSRAEFERRYEALPRLKKAELVEGVVYIGSPVRASEHADPHFELIGWLYGYVAATPGVLGGDNATVRLDLDNEPQPDVHLRIPAERGGLARLVDGYLEGAVELVAEVSASSASYDLHDKRNAYRRNGVREYVVWRVLDREIDWFVLREGRYEILPRDEAGIQRSEVFPGLWLDGAALVRGDRARVLEVLQLGLVSQEHLDLVRRLAG